MVAGSAFPAPAATPGIDLAVVIDQSGSMWGNPAVHPGKNDPWQHRIGAAKHIVFRLMQHVSDTSMVHRVAVVEFADDAQVALPAETIRFDPASSVALDKLRARLETTLTAKDWGNTNTAAALQVARGELERMSHAAPPGPRRRILLLLTDGRPTLPGVDNAVLRARIRDEAGRLSSEGIELWVVGLNDADNYWNAGEGTFWEELTAKGRARLAETASSALPSIFQGIVDEWLGLHSVTVRDDQYDCPPYLRRIVFNVTFGRPRGDVRITDPDGRVVPRTGGGPPVSPGTMALFAVDDPKPGIYTIVRDPTRADTVHVEEFSPVIDRLEPRGQADAGVEGRVVFIARKTSGEIVKAVPEYPIDAGVLVTDPLGNQSDLTTKTGPDGRFAANWKPARAGRYRVVLRGLIRRKDGSTYDIFANSALSYSQIVDVGTRKPYSLRLLMPVPAKGLRLAPWKRETNLRFELVDPAGAPVAKLPGVVVGPETWLSVQSLDSAGVALGSIVPMRAEGGGQFGATVPLHVAWAGGEGIRRPGKLYFRVYEKPGHLIGDRYLRSVQLPPGLEDRHLAGDPLSVGPIDIRLAVWLWSVLAALAFTGAAFLIWVVVGRWLPAFLIRREDRRARRTLRLRVYDEVSDPAGSAAQEFNVTGRRAADLSLTVEVEGAFVGTKFLRFVRELGDRRPRATLLYRWRESKRKYSTRVSTSSPRTLDGLPVTNYVVLLVEESNA